MAAISISMSASPLPTVPSSGPPSTLSTVTEFESPKHDLYAEISLEELAFISGSAIVTPAPSCPSSSKSFSWYFVASWSGVYSPATSAAVVAAEQAAGGLTEGTGSPATAGTRAPVSGVPAVAAELTTSRRVRAPTRSGLAEKSCGPSRVLRPTTPLTSPPARSAGSSGEPEARTPDTPATVLYRPKSMPNARDAAPAVPTAEMTNGDSADTVKPSDRSHDSASTAAHEGGPN